MLRIFGIYQTTYRVLTSQNRQIYISINKQSNYCNPKSENFENITLLPNIYISVTKNQKNLRESECGLLFSHSRLLFHLSKQTVKSTSL